MIHNLLCSNYVNLVPICDKQKFATGREKQYVNCKKRKQKWRVYKEKLCVHNATYKV